MSLALKVARWNEGYRWTAYIQMGILLVCILSLPLWKKSVCWKSHIGRWQP